MFLVTQKDDSTYEIINYVHVEGSDGNRVKKAIEYLCETEEVVWHRPNPKVPRYYVEATYYNNRNIPYKVNTTIAVVPVVTLC